MSEPTCEPGFSANLDGAPADVVGAVWAGALGLDAVDAEVGFFDLGATSEMVVSVTEILRRRWPCLRIADIFSHPTAAELAAFLDDADG